MAHVCVSSPCPVCTPNAANLVVGDVQGGVLLERFLALALNGELLFETGSKQMLDDAGPDRNRARWTIVLLETTDRAGQIDLLDEQQKYEMYDRLLVRFADHIKALDGRKREPTSVYDSVMRAYHEAAERMTIDTYREPMQITFALHPEVFCAFRDEVGRRNSVVATYGYDPPSVTIDGVFRVEMRAP